MTLHRPSRWGCGDWTKPRPVLPLCCLCLMVLAGVAAAQQPAAADSAVTTAADTTGADDRGMTDLQRAMAGAAAAADTSATALYDTTLTDRRGMTDLERALADAAAAADSTRAPVLAPQGPLFVSFTNTPKAGVKANVRQYTYYGDIDSKIAMSKNSGLDTKLSWSWEDYRKTIKTVERRNATVSYRAGALLPMDLNATGSWDWSEDNTVNSQGLANLAKRDFKKATVTLNKSGLQTGRLMNAVRMAAGLTDQQSINQSQRSDIFELNGNAGLKTGAEIAEGLTAAIRLYGSRAQGERLLGDQTSPSSAAGDTMGAGVYYNRQLISGHFVVSRSNYDNRYLDFKRNAQGLIDTTGITNEDDKVVEELEAKDATSFSFNNRMKWRRLGLDANFSRDYDELAYSVSSVGSRQNFQDRMDLQMTFGVGRDSFVVSYKYGLRWNDQRPKGATVNRGRQYSKSQAYKFSWMKTIFSALDLVLVYNTELTQDTAEVVDGEPYNKNDKDQLREGVTFKMQRNWSAKFDASMVIDYRQVQDISIRQSRSANNNVKDSYEITPAYTWQISEWLELYQNYKVYIQYTNYNFIDYVNKDDNYNKRGVLNTRVTLRPTSRVAVVIKHDYNKRFNASKTYTDASGTSKYFEDLRQTISTLDLGIVFRAAPGVTLEGATYSTEDYKEDRGLDTQVTTTHGGEIWLGGRVNRKWGTENPLELSAMVKKFNAFGPGVTETSRDYWEADVWLKWSF